MCCIRCAAFFSNTLRRKKKKINNPISNNSISKHNPLSLWWTFHALSCVDKSLQAQNACIIWNCRHQSIELGVIINLPTPLEATVLINSTILFMFDWKPMRLTWQIFLHITLRLILKRFLSLSCCERAFVHQNTVDKFQKRFSSTRVETQLKAALKCHGQAARSSIEQIYVWRSNWVNVSHILLNRTEISAYKEFAIIVTS